MYSVTLYFHLGEFTFVPANEALELFKKEAYRLLQDRQLGATEDEQTMETVVVSCQFPRDHTRYQRITLAVFDHQPPDKQPVHSSVVYDSLEDRILTPSEVGQVGEGDVASCEKELELQSRGMKGSPIPLVQICLQFQP